MALWRRLKTVWRNLAQKDRVDAQLDDEIQSYQQMLEDEKIRAGADPLAARREARLELGGAQHVKEEVQDVRLGATLDALRTELRQSLRGLRRNPALSIMGTAMLALGLGASTVVFSIFHAALLKPLPFRDAGSVVQIWETRLERNVEQASFTEANFWDVRAQSRSFEELAASHYYGEANLTGDGPPEKVVTIRVSAGFFRTLGVSPVLGRDFTYDEDRGGLINPVVLVGHRFWVSRYGADRNILGKTVRLNDRPYTVVGVLPPSEIWLNSEFYTPFGYRAGADRGSWEFNVIGRLKPGVPLEAAQADLQQIAASLGATYPKEAKGIGFRLAPSSIWIASDTTRRGLWVLLGAVTFLLLIACVNLANLLLARGTARQREIAVRLALGAGRARLMRFVMMESLLLSAFGAILGVVLAYTALGTIQALEIRGVPRIAEAGLNVWVLAFAAGLALLTGLLSGLAPALQAPAGNVVGALRDGDRQTGSRRQGRLRSALVMGEVALSFALLVGAGLLIRSFTELMNADRGFHTENRLVFSVSMPGSYYEKGVGKQFMDRLFERLSAVPEVVAAGAVSHRPVEGGNPGMAIDSNSRANTPGQTNAPWAGWRVVTPGYFRAVGLPLLRGRLFDENDKPVWAEPGQPPPPRRVVISERLAKILFPGEDAVGKPVVLWKGQSGRDAEVVGVVGDSRERGLVAGPALTVYLPYGRNALPSEFILHTRGDPMAVLSTVRSLVGELDANLPIADVRSFEEVVHRSVAPQRFNTVLLGIFSGLALLLATTGIYGVLSYSMTRRTAEIGLRVALGANARSILAMAIGQGMRPALAGIAVGVLGAWWLTRYLASLLFGVQPLDAITYAAVGAVVILTALLACYIPGRRATRVDPAIALRIE